MLRPRERRDADMDGVDLFALMSAVAWLAGQPGFAPRTDRLLDLITSAILTKPAGEVVKKAKR